MHDLVSPQETAPTWDDDLWPAHGDPHPGHGPGLPPGDSAPLALGRADADSRRRLLGAHVRRELARTLGLPPEDLDDGRLSPQKLGVGSIAGLELQRRLEAALSVSVGLSEVLTAAAIDDLTDHLASRYERTGG